MDAFLLNRYCAVQFDPAGRIENSWSTTVVDDSRLLPRMAKTPRDKQLSFLLGFIGHVMGRGEKRLDRVRYHIQQLGERDIAPRRGTSVESE